MATNKSKDSEIAVLQTQMETVISSLEDINTKLDTFATNSRVNALENKIKELDRKKTIQTWITGVLSMMLGVFLTILVQAYFKKDI